MDFNSTKFSRLSHILLYSCFCTLSCTRADKLGYRPDGDTCFTPQINVVDSYLIPADTVPYDSTRVYCQMLKSLGVVPITEIDSSIRIDLKYSGTDNFMGQDLYGDVTDAYLQVDAARSLAVAQSRLKDIDSNLSLIVFDATRPRVVQSKMWSGFDASEDVKRKFLAEPSAVSMHNLGMAVDVSIIINDGTLLDMGTDFDDWSELSYPCLEYYLANKGLLGYNHVNNRSVLRFVMELAGFTQNRYEWWHFYYKNKQLALAQYPIIEDFKTYSMPVCSTQAVASAHVTFSVQLAASMTKLNHNMICCADYREYKHEKMFKYCSGEFDNLESAYKYRDSLLKSSCKNVFVISFYDGQRIPIQQALTLKETE